jgi:hypothetical protein
LSFNRIRTRLLFVFGLLSALMLLAAIAGALGTRNILETATQTMHGELRLAQLSTQLSVEALQLRRFEKDVFINIESADKVQDYRAKWERALESAGKCAAMRRSSRPAILANLCWLSLTSCSLTLPASALRPMQSVRAR